ncbi:hypothetical protein GBF38_011616 [Nibea albiflora]|uniref:Uncharacterized protein n=1 Tax=Nibea albiflora TaxID=240163 RepID=A0ACB7F3X3_NIBAL|nr:hypothetical protein GBF38_011616 [Nibea albiflora]
MDESWVSGLTSSLSTFFNQEAQVAQVVEVLKNVGVCSSEDLKYVAADDLAAVLRPIEARKVMACIKNLMTRIEDSSSSISTSHMEESSTEDSFMSDIPITIHSTPKSTASSSPALTIASPTGSESSVREDNSWHYSFDIPWSKMPSSTRKLFDTGKRPSAAQRREIIRIVAGEILNVCKKPGKKHVSEISRKMVLCYPKSFQDEIEGQIVGTGYDSLVKQFISRLDNCKRLQAATAQKRLPEGCSPDNGKRACKDAYGCINCEPELLPGETKQLQKQKQEELIKMYKNKDKDAKKIERLMVETFPSQRRDLLSGLKETEEFLKEWPFLCQEAGMRLHFRELTGVQLDDSFEESRATKFRRILQYFQFGKTESSTATNTILRQALAGGEETSAAVLILVAHFKEQQEKMFINVDDTAIGTDVDTTKLPWTPCIVVCGRCIFKINPDQGTKVKRKEKGRQYAVNPRVLSLISNIANFEWTE